MFQNALSSLSIKKKMGLAVALPIAGLIFFAVAFCLGQWKTVENMRRTVQLTNFSQSVSEVVHELQVERGRTAAYIGSGKSPQAESLLEAQARRVAQVQAAFIESAEGFRDQVQTDTQRAHIEHALEDLLALSEHRADVRSETTTVPEAVGPYTTVINDLILLIADEATLVGDSDLSGAIQGMLQLTQAKEAAGLERARGSAVLASGDISQPAHQALVAINSVQQEMLRNYRSFMPEEWDDVLNRVEVSANNQRIESIRNALHNAGYDGNLPDVSSNEWFDLTTTRIEQMMEITDQVSAHILEIAVAKQNSLTALVWTVIAVSIVITFITMLVSYVLVSSIVKPMSRITGALDDLSNGATDIEIVGVERGDEIGVLARAADRFMDMSRQREELMKESAANEHNSMIERRRVLDQMAREVEEATHKSVSGIVVSSEELAKMAEAMRTRLTSASDNATAANAATTQSLDGTQRASELADQLNVAISEVAESIMRGDQMARDTVQVAVDSRACVEELDEATQQIGDFVRVITELAEQTNLLALNATIESARAGEHGKGFAVVASEIKQLASQTNTSATQITDRVNQIQSRTKTAVDAINRISQSIEQLGGVTSSIAAAVEEQRASTDSFTGFLSDNREAIQDVARQVSDLTRITQETSENATAMSAQVAKMTTASRQANDEIPQIVQRAVVAADNRGAPRTKTDQQVIMSQDGSKRPASIKDVSTTGARLNKPTKGKFNVSLPGLGEVPAHTAWSSDTESGVEFEKPLAGNLMQQLIDAARKDGAA